MVIHTKQTKAHHNCWGVICVHSPICLVILFRVCCSGLHLTPCYCLLDSLMSLGACSSAAVTRAQSTSTRPVFFHHCQKFLHLTSSICWTYSLWMHLVFHNTSSHFLRPSVFFCLTYSIVSSSWVGILLTYPWIVLERSFHCLHSHIALDFKGNPTCIIKLIHVVCHNVYTDMQKCRFYRTQWRSVQSSETVDLWSHLCKLWPSGQWLYQDRLKKSFPVQFEYILWAVVHFSRSGVQGGHNASGSTSVSFLSNSYLLSKRCVWGHCLPVWQGYFLSRQVSEGFAGHCKPH